MTYAELAAGARNRDGVDEDLKPFQRLEWIFTPPGGRAKGSGADRPAKGDNPVLPDFLIRGQAAAHSLPHLTNDRRRVAGVA